MSSMPPELDSLVRSSFTVTDTFQLPEGEAEYRVAYTAESRLRFKDLHRKAAAMGFTPRLMGSREECTLTLRRTLTAPRRQSRVPTILALLSLISIIAFSLLEKALYGEFAPGVPGLVVIASYSLGVIAVLAAHEFGHRSAARRNRELSLTSYLIPGIPGLTAFLPVIGPLSTQKGPATNRDGLFDVLLWGPLAGFVVALALSLVGEFDTVVSSIPLQGNQVVNTFIAVKFSNPSAIQYALDWLLSPFIVQVPSGFVLLSPIGDAATVGLLLTFIGLLPMASFDGGMLASTVWGSKVSRLATYASALVLISFDTLNYFAIAIFVILIAGRQLNVQLLDEVSEISRRRKWVYGAAVVLAFLCVPLPQLPGLTLG